jgi:stage IV sporulation protein B
MRKLSFFVLGAVMSFGFVGHGIIIRHANAEETIVCVGGMSAGFTLKSGEAQVIGLCEVVTENGVVSPAVQAGLRSGDRIVKVAGIRVETIDELNEIIGKSGGKAIAVEIIRGQEQLKITIQPVKDKITDRYKIGILARDSVSGIGTVTYIDKRKARFGSLGHSVTKENKAPLRISDGIVYECSIVGVQKGIRGKAGELRGMFISDKQVGVAEKLCDCGIFGTVSKDFDYQNMQTVVASSSQVTMGKAYIYSTVNGISPQKYEIEIVKVDKNNKENKNYVIKITDDTLISETGGIVQGMSGSPILQNGRMVGAVTHVFINDPTRGYGIDIQTMLCE